MWQISDHTELHTVIKIHLFGVYCTIVCVRVRVHVCVCVCMCV